MVHAEKERVLAERQLVSSRCPSCPGRNTIILEAVLKHVNLYWIPFAPHKIYIRAFCTECESLIQFEEMPEQMKREAKWLRQEVKMPLWSFTGVGIVAIVIGLIIWNLFRLSENSKEYIHKPQNGDRYTIRISKGGIFEDPKYTYFKIIKIEGDTIWFKCNVRKSKSKELYQIDKEINYKRVAKISREKVIKMYDKDEISDITRED